MTSHLSERFHDQERSDLYCDLVQSSLDRPAGGDQAWLLDEIASTAPRPLKVRPAAPHRSIPRVSFRWFALPRLPVPFLTWASS